MANHGIIVGLDVGSTTIKALAADVRHQQANIIGAAIGVSHGVNRGGIVDIEATTADIQAVMAQLMAQNNQQPIQDVVASIPAYNVQIQNVAGTVTVQDSQHITYEDVMAVTKEALAIELPADRRVVDLVPVDFAVDDFDGIKDPNDMVGVRLSIRAVAYTAPAHVLTNLQKAIVGAGLRVKDFVLSPLATSRAVLTEEQRRFGATILDMGAGHTSATVVKDEQIHFITVFPAGSANISNDISTVLNVSSAQGEQLKIDEAVASPRLAGEEQILINVVGEAQPERVTQRYISEIVAARVEQIADKLAEKLNMVSATQLPGGMVMIGGGAELRGMAEALTVLFDANVSSFAPDEIGLRHTGYAAVWSLIQSAAQQSTAELVVKKALYGLPLETSRQLRAAPVTRPRIEAVSPKPGDDDTEATIKDNIEKQTGRMSKFFSNYFD